MAPTPEASGRLSWPRTSLSRAASRWGLVLPCWFPWRTRQVLMRLLIPRGVLTLEMQRQEKIQKHKKRKIYINNNFVKKIHLFQIHSAFWLAHKNRMMKEDLVGVIVWGKNQFNIILLSIFAARKAHAASSNSNISVSRNPWITYYKTPSVLPSHNQHFSLIHF